jgi:signal peptidase II
MIWAVIIIIIVAIDQLAKLYIIRTVDYGAMIPLINKFFYITYHENTGAAWGILKNGRIFLIAMTVVTSAVLLYILIKNDNKLLRLSLSFILGGAFGNLVDRVVKGSVADFLDLYFGSYNFPTFNIADSFVVIGTGILVFYLLFVYKENAGE